MFQVRYAGRIQRQIYSNDIEPTWCIVQASILQEPAGGPGDMPLFPRVHPGLRIAEPPAGAGLDFHEDEFVSVPGDEVDFASGGGIPEIPGQYGMALPAQERFRDGLAA